MWCRSGPRSTPSSRQADGLDRGDSRERRAGTASLVQPALPGLADLTVAAVLRDLLPRAARDPGGVLARHPDRVRLDLLRLRHQPVPPDSRPFVPQNLLSHAVDGGERVAPDDPGRL